MALLLKINALWSAFKALFTAFPNTRADAESLFAEIENAIVTKSWTLTAAYQAIASAEALVSAFVAEWDGSQAQWDAFKDALTGLFN